MAHKIWPVSSMYYPLVHSIEVDNVINPFGSGYEQRIITEFPRGPRADGTGGLSTYVGQNMFSVNLNNLLFYNQPHPTNASIDNSIRKLWQFYRECFYDPVTGAVMWDPFYFYNLTENDNVVTWTGDVASAGVNSQNEPVTNEIGRYLARFSDARLSITRFRTCLFNSSLQLTEVAA